MVSISLNWAHLATDTLVDDGKNARFRVICNYISLPSCSVSSFRLFRPPPQLQMSKSVGYHSNGMNG